MLLSNRLSSDWNSFHRLVVGRWWQEPERMSCGLFLCCGRISGIMSIVTEVAACESFMKILKYEEVHRNEYRDLNEAQSTIRVFIEKVYNQKRLHSAIGYVPPAEFEANLLTQQKEAAARQLT